MHQGKNIADAAARVDTLEYFIWSSMPFAVAVSGGWLTVPHMDGKAGVDAYIATQQPPLACKTTFLYVGFYAANLRLTNFAPIALPSAAGGKYVLIREAGRRKLVPMAGDEAANVGVVVCTVLQQRQMLTCGDMSVLWWSGWSMVTC